MIKKFLITFFLIFSHSAHADLSNTIIDSITNPVGVTQSGPFTVSSSGTSSVTQVTSPWVDNISQFGGSSVVTGTGASGSGIPRITVSNDSKVFVWDGTNTQPAGDAPARSIYTKSTDGTNTQGITVNSDAKVVDYYNTAFSSANITVGASQIIANVSGSTNLANRKLLTIYNNSSVTCFYGPTGITISGATQGDVLFAQQYVSISAGPSISVYIICGTAGNSFIVKEYS